MLSHFAKLTAIALAAQTHAASLPDNYENHAQRHESLLLSRACDFLISTLATDSIHRDELLERLAARPDTLAIAALIIREHDGCPEDVDACLYDILMASYDAEDAATIDDGGDDWASMMPTKIEQSVSLTARMREGAWGPFHEQSKHEPKPKGKTLADKRKGFASAA